MRRWLAVVVLLLAALLGWVAAGPYVTMHAIGKAVREENAAALARHVDFPRLRASLRDQAGDRLSRSLGLDGQSGWIGALGAGVAQQLAGGAIDLMVTPYGLGALIEGRKVWNRASGLPPARTEEGARARPDPWRNAVRRYESASRFTATVRTDDGQPLVFVLTRDGLRWRLSDIRLPPEAP
ncbi:DUF2939 domain-containing protein [Luteimonas composti]|uniref:DUF2939 domain-containing protein n=1 Tax=Luteimonas composti TaxID=398257 RepID=A0ABT6MM72_9GAMM|nr:DUF2939 domain-containing protein [Luteimonas composti]MDH7451687.1 DUF2939 domain-containing protein [Luteimonas composti]